MKNTFRNSEDRMRGEMKGHEFSFDPVAWEKMSQKLDGHGQSGKLEKKTLGLFRPILGLLAIVLAIIFFTLTAQQSEVSPSGIPDIKETDFPKEHTVPSLKPNDEVEHQEAENEEPLALKDDKKIESAGSTDHKIYSDKQGVIQDFAVTPTERGRLIRSEEPLVEIQAEDLKFLHTGRATKRKIKPVTEASLADQSVEEKAITQIEHIEKMALTPHRETALLEVLQWSAARKREIKAIDDRFKIRPNIDRTLPLELAANISFRPAYEESIIYTDLTGNDHTLFFSNNNQLFGGLYARYFPLRYIGFKAGIDIGYTSREIMSTVDPNAVLDNLEGNLDKKKSLLMGIPISIQLKMKHIRAYGGVAYQYYFTPGGSTPSLDYTYQTNNTQRIRVSLIPEDRQHMWNGFAGIGFDLGRWSADLQMDIIDGYTINYSGDVLGENSSETRKRTLASIHLSYRWAQLRKGRIKSYL